MLQPELLSKTPERAWPPRHLLLLRRRLKAALLSLILPVFPLCRTAQTLLYPDSPASRKPNSYPTPRICSCGWVPESLVFTAWYVAMVHTVLPAPMS